MAEYDEEEVFAEDEEAFLALFPEDDDALEEDDDAADSGEAKWIDVKCEWEADVELTVGETQEESWEQAQEEIQTVMKMLSEKTKTPVDGHLSLKKIVDLMYGEKGKIFRVFKDNLKWTYPFFRSFLATLAFQHAMNLSATRLYDENAMRISKSGFLSEKQYVEAWDTIGRHGLAHKHNAPNSISHGKKFFWHQVQDAFNETYRLLFVCEIERDDDSASDASPREHYIQKFVCDDFKVYFVSGIKEFAGLRISQHTRANRRGPVMHQLVRTASGIITGIYFEKGNDNGVTATINLIKQQVFPSQSSDFSKLNLSGIELSTDRGYNQKGVTESFVQSGAEINGTKAMTLDCPFVYGKKVRDGDNRMELDKEGGKTLWIKKKKIGSRFIYMQAYRNGNGGIVIGVTTKFPGFQWELVLKNPKDLLWYRNEVQAFVAPNPTEDESLKIYERCFPGVFKAPSRDFLLTLRHFNYALLTTCQGTAEWFFLRSFSCTSRSVFFMMEVLQKASQSEIETWLRDKEKHKFEYAELKASYKTVLTLLGGKQNLDDTENEAIAEPILEVARQDLIVEEALFQHDDESKAEVQKYAANLSEYKPALLGIVERLGGKSTASDHLLKAWLASDVQLRAAYFDKASLEAKYMKIPSEFKPQLAPGKSVTIRHIRESLTNYYKANASDKEAIKNLKKNQTKSGALSLEQKLTKALLESTYLPKLQGKGKEFAQTGSRYEEPIAKKMFRELKRNNKYLPEIELYDMCHAPLIGSQTGIDREDPKDQNSIKSFHHSFGAFMQKCSADFICWGTRNGQHMHIGVEVKTRVTLQTIDAAMEQQRTVQRILRWQNQSMNGSQKKYIILNWDSKFLHKVIPSKAELLQMLHCAALYCTNYWMLLVGSGTTGQVMYGVIVVFPEAVLLSWDRVSEAMGIASTTLLFHWDEPESKSRLEEVVSKVKTSKTGKLDLQTLYQFWFMYLNGIATIPFPLPPCSRYIPKTFAYWNANKSGSDTRSKLAAHAEYNPPSKLIQSIVVALMLGDGFTSVHRMYQIATAKQDLASAYPSLAHFRNAANKRVSYKDTLLQCSNLLSGLQNRQLITPMPRLKARMATIQRTPTARVVDQSERRHSTRHFNEHGIIDIETGTDVTGETPHNLIAASYDAIAKKPKEERSDVEQMLLERKQICTGPAFLLSQNPPVQGNNMLKPRGVCAACGERHATMFCYGCHAYFHVGKPIDKTTKEHKDILVRQPGGKGAYCVLDCFTWSHPAIIGDPTIFESIQEPSILANAKQKTKKRKRKNKDTEKNITAPEDSDDDRKPAAKPKRNDTRVPLKNTETAEETVPPPTNPTERLDPTQRPYFMTGRKRTKRRPQQN